MNQDWLYGFLSGVIATIIGFVLTIAWELWKEKRGKANRASVVKHAVAADLAVNAGRIQKNVNALNQELPVLNQRMSVVVPLALLRTSFWDIARMNPPGDVISLGDATLLHDIVDLTEQVNERIRSRESFRQHNGAMSNFPSQMKIYDEDLVQTMTQLEAAMTQASDVTKLPPSVKLNGRAHS